MDKTTGNKLSVKFQRLHPFWDKAVELRQMHVPLSEIVEAGHAAGYVDLTYSAVGRALRHAAADLHLPAYSSRFLRRRYEDIGKSFDSFQAMRDLAQDALRELAELEEELADPECSSIKYEALRVLREQTAERAFRWAASCAGIALKLEEGERYARSGVTAVVEGETSTEGDMTENLEEVLKSFKKSLPALEPTSLRDQYGAGNVRLPGERGEGSNVDEEED